MTVPASACRFLPNPSQREIRGSNEKGGRTDENGRDVGGGDAVARNGDVLDEEVEDGLEGEVLPVRECNRESVSVDELREESKRRRSRDALVRETHQQTYEEGKRRERTLRSTESSASPYRKSLSIRSHSINFFRFSLPTLRSPSNAASPSIACFPSYTTPPDPAPANSAS